MPFPTFFNLPEEKRARILRAIQDEFARVPFEEFSINRIIQQAEIPRGSFYQYFEDKRDVLGYVLADCQQIVYRAALESLQAQGGDIFQMFIDVLDFTVEFVLKEQTYAFLHNLLADVRINIGMYSSLVDKSKKQELMDELAAQVDMSVLDIRDSDDFLLMLGVLLPLSGQVIAHVFFDVSKYEEIRTGYIRELALLKRGFLREKDMRP